MSQTFDYFFNYGGAFAQLASAVRAELGVDVSPCSNDSDDLCGRLLGMDFFLGRHDYENDLQIPFEDYRYCAGLKTFLPDGDLRPLQVTVMAAIPYILHRRLGITGMLVFDLQHLISLYESRIGSDDKTILFDTVSQTVVRLPDHWQTVSQRLPARAFTTEAELSTIDYLRSIGRLDQGDT